VLDYVVLAGSFVAGFGTLYLIGRLWQYRERPGAKLFVAALAAQAVFCFSYGSGLVVFDPLARELFEAVTLFVLPWIGVLFLGFAFGYTGRSNLLWTWWYRIPVATAGILSGLIVTNHWHELVWRAFEVVRIGEIAGASYTHEPVLFVLLGFSTLWVVIGTMLLFDTVISYGPLFRGEAIAVGLSPILPGIAILVWLFEVGPEPAINFTALAFLPHVVLDGYAFVKRDMFEFLPGTRRAGEQAAIQDLDNPVVIVDIDGRIVTLNAAAESLLGIDEQAALTRQLSTVLGTEVDLGVADQRLSIRTDGQQREFLVTPSTLTDTAGGQVGSTLVFQDVTDAIQREQRLTVMNRVLRHNLRNDLNVVHGFLEAGRERVDDAETSRMLERAARKTDTLVSTGEKVRDIESTIGAAGERTSFDLASQLRAIANDLDAEHDGRIESSFPEGVTVTTNREVLELVITNLLENAIEHGTDPDGTVDLSATAEDDRVTITVSDDGPGIPENELATIEQETETDLVHGSGLGLWIVTWGVRQLGGEIDLETGEAGTTVTVTLPRES
jgi:PAS domain S-box-containing protein